MCVRASDLGETGDLPCGPLLRRAHGSGGGGGGSCSRTHPLVFLRLFTPHRPESLPHLGHANTWPLLLHTLALGLAVEDDCAWRVGVGGWDGWGAQAAPPGRLRRRHGRRLHGPDGFLGAFGSFLGFSFASAFGCGSPHGEAQSNDHQGAMPVSVQAKRRKLVVPPFSPWLRL